MIAGSYSGQAALYDSNAAGLICLLQGQKGGLTQVAHPPDTQHHLHGEYCQNWHINGIE